MNKKELPDERGHFGPYGGMFVADTLVDALQQLQKAYAYYRTDPEFFSRISRINRLCRADPIPYIMLSV